MKPTLLILISLLFLALPVTAQEFGSISGTVSIGDHPVESAIITAWVLNDPNGGNNGHPRVTRTDAHGNYSLVQVIAGRVVIQAQLPQGGEPQVQNIEVAANRNTVANFNFRDHQDDEFGVVYGNVTSPDGPMPNALVMLISGDHRMHSTRTNREGAYRFEQVLVGHYIARAQLEFGQARDHEIDVVVNEEIEVNFQFEAGNHEMTFGAVSGTVSDPDGAPLARAEVFVLAVVDGGGPNNGERHEINLMTHTDAEGQYRIGQIPVGVQLITAGKFGYVPFHGEVEIIENEVTVVDIVLAPVQHEELIFGSVSGTVNSAAGEVIAEAHVLLIPRGDPAGNNEWPHDPNRGGGQLVTFTDEQGAYNFDEVPVGSYLARAAKRGFTPADQEIEVLDAQVTAANFVLDANENGGGNGGGEGRHDGEPIELHGIAIVIEGDVADIYLLDSDADGAADYLLNFGPPDYDPENGAVRPATGDEIDVTGVIAGHMEPPMVLVMTINGNVWRDPDGGDHGGRPGGGNGWNGDENLELVEAEGTVAVNPNSPWYHRYFLNIDDNIRAEYVLFFGEDDYEPGNGLVRPEDGAFVNIIGGLFQPREGLPVIVVYQLNGQLWREPGDTLELYWQDPNVVEDASSVLPTNSILVETYPNPFNPKATVSVTLPVASFARVSLIDLTGREVIKLSSGYMEGGQHNLTLNGNEIEAGAYFLRVETPTGGIVQKVTLLK